MKVMQVLPRLDVGGVERGTFDFAMYLKKHGHEAVVVSGGGRMVETLEKNGVKHYTLPVGKKNIFTALYACAKLRSIIEAEKPDIVHGRSRMPDWIAYFATLKTSAQLIITAHGCHSRSPYSEIVDASKLVITPSNTAARYFVDEFKVNPSKIRIVPRGLSLEEFTYRAAETKKNNRTVAFVGRLTPIKGVEYLIESMNAVLRAFPDARCLIVGEADAKHKKYEDYLKSYVVRLGLQGKVVFVGHKKTADILDDAAVLVLPSLVPETFGRVIIEAQAKGVAVVSTDLGAPKEIITDGMTGLLTAAADAQGIADCVKRYFSDFSFFSDVTTRARRSVESNYTLDKMCSHTIEVYREALASKKILVYKLASLGDAVLATATMRTLKKEFPDARISVVVGKRFASVFTGQACVDEAIVFDDKGPFRRLKAIALGNKLARRCFDLSVDLQNSKTSQTISFFARVKKTLGVARKFTFVNDMNADYRIVKDLSPLESQKYIVSPIVKGDFLPPLITPDAVIRARMRELKGDAQYLIGINAGASSKWKTKNPDPRLYEEFVKSYDKDAKFVFFGTGEYSAAVKTVVEKYRGKVIDMTGKTGITELIALIAACDAVITPDSAPLHIALAVGVPVVTMFGPTDPSRHIDVHMYRNVEVLRKHLTCLPCYKKNCPHNRYACLDFSPQELIDAVQSVLQGKQT